MTDFSNHLDELSSVVNGWPEWKKNIFGNYKEQKPMSEQFFKNPNECLKWCIDHPGEKCQDVEGRKIWFMCSYKVNSHLNFWTNMQEGGLISEHGCYLLCSKDLILFDVPTLRPMNPDLTKPACSFCQKTDGCIFVAKKNLAICDGCIGIASKELEDERNNEVNATSIDPQKPTLANLAALENWDWMKIGYPGDPETLFRATWGKWRFQYSDLRTALSAGWPVEFGRGEA